jgi:hypothetical protein
MGGMMDGCNEPECVICQWIGERIIRFNDEMKAALMASAPPPITYRRWLPGDPT